jgi:hypothetical protein
MPTSFSRILDEADLAEIRNQYLAALEALEALEAEENADGPEAGEAEADTLEADNNAGA